MAESSVIITDEAVEAVAEQLWIEIWSDTKPYSSATDSEKNVCLSARTVLEAALPFLQGSAAETGQQVKRLLRELRADRDEHVVSMVQRRVAAQGGNASSSEVEMWEAWARCAWNDGHGYSSRLLDESRER